MVPSNVSSRKRTVITIGVGASVGVPLAAAIGTAVTSESRPRNICIITVSATAEIAVSGRRPIRRTIRSGMATWPRRWSISGLRKTNDWAGMLGVVVLPADLPVHELIRGADHPHQVVVAHRLEPAREPRRGQRGGSFEIEAADRIVRRDDVAQSANRPLAVVDDGAGEQILFVFERDLVGAIGGCQRRDDDADDRHRDDDAKRHDNAEARAIPRRGLLIVPRLSQPPGRHNRHALLRTRPTRDGRRQCLLFA